MLLKILSPPVGSIGSHFAPRIDLSALTIMLVIPSNDSTQERLKDFAELEKRALVNVLTSLPVFTFWVWFKD